LHQFYVHENVYDDVRTELEVGQQSADVAGVSNLVVGAGLYDRLILLDLDMPGEVLFAKKKNSPDAVMIKGAIKGEIISAMTPLRNGKCGRLGPVALVTASVPVPGGRNLSHHGVIQ
jgi:hypothetical protein|tara:strand:+ start:364 stop:714 length:351 start_codon:yes stop_codon:yes gene_type:complete